MYSVVFGLIEGEMMCESVLVYSRSDLFKTI